jgi:phosphoglycolate phosphatase
MTIPAHKKLLWRAQAYDHVYTGLVTGNLEPIGWSKMEALGILGLFSNPYFGGFGSDFCSGDTVDTWKDRGELVRIAARRCDDLHGNFFSFSF